MAGSGLPAEADIFNSRYFGRQPSPAPGTDVGFPLFAQLPRELRLQIWACHLHRRRFLRVLLQEAEPEASQLYPAPASDDDEWASIFSTRPSETETSWLPAGPTAPLLRVTFLGAPSPEMPALRLVCREALYAHNSVYRIRLPAHAHIPWGVGAPGHTTTRIVAHLNPELDILSLQTPISRQIATLNLLPFFLHHVLQHDFSPGPLRLGVRHLCVDLRHLGNDSMYSHSADEASREDGPARLGPDVLASVRLSVSHLRSLYFRLTTAGHLEPRVMSGPLTTRSRPWYNASVPVLPAASWGFPAAVEPVRGGDPRLAHPEGAADLRQVWIGSQLRPSLDVWAGLGRMWGVPAGGGAGGTRVRALVALDAEDWTTHRMDHRGGGGGGSSSSLGAYLHEERAAWQSLMDPAQDVGGVLRGCFQTAQQTFLPGLPAVAPEEWISRRVPHTAVGFWLVDPEVLETAETKGYAGKKIADLSERRAEDIELWVFGGHF